MSMEKHHLSESVRVIIEARFGGRYAKLQQKEADGWKTLSGRNFTMDIRVNALEAMTRVAVQRELIPQPEERNLMGAIA